MALSGIGRPSSILRQISEGLVFDIDTVPFSASANHIHNLRQVVKRIRGEKSFFISLPETQKVNHKLRYFHDRRTHSHIAS